MRCHVTKTHSSITNKQTKKSSSEVRTKTVAFMHQNSILVAWINDGRPSFLLWLRQRLLVVFGEEIGGCSRCNSAMEFFWVVKFPRLHDAQLWRVFSFKCRLIALCMILMDSSPVSVSFCDLGVELYNNNNLYCTHTSSKKLQNRKKLRIKLEY